VTVGELRGRGLRLTAGSRVLLDGFDFRAVAGEMLGLAGPSGSGKTTLLQVLAGLTRPDEGQVLVDGTPGEPWKQVTLALVPQTVRLVGVLTAEETVAVPLQSAGLGGDEIGRRTLEVLTELGLEGLADQLLSTLSGGQRQRLAIAQALARRPAILLADEPTSALDTQWQGQVMSSIRRRAEEGAIVVVASNDGETLATCHRIVEI
jgi:putative ABC transport system ATP-binding protein